ncbi:hypothetical protein QQX09_09250 [Demequina sp. SYSU T00192]|uniref:Lipoprotein n=1 Tax=Demequina litoralis TaxID=3051660 RepID=A0ABT8GA73_9MICO|nr:DUF6174 domain-containing protein [Demequina sp. SYSU T00192]MDN4476038.1 hypothetical protein [Demequina sp. SYSU T00192]
MGEATMRRAGRALLVASVAGLLGACGILSGSDEPWDEPADYTYDATITVFGPSAGEWRITVRDHAVAGARPLDDTALGSSATLDDFATFAEYEAGHAQAQERGDAVSRLVRTRDGALKSYEHDGSKDAVDDEYLIVVSQVTVP